MISLFTYFGTSTDGFLWFQPTVIIDFTYWNQSHIGRIVPNYTRGNIYASLDDMFGTESIVMVNDLLN